MNGRPAGRRVWVRAALVATLLAVVPAAAQEGSPAGPVPPELLTARRAALLERIGEGVALLHAASPQDGGYPQASDFRQHNDFFYLTGLDVPDAALLLIARASAPDQTILYLPERNPAQERWSGVRLGPGLEAAGLTGIDDVRPADGLDDDLAGLLADTTSAAARGGLWLGTRRITCEEPEDGGCRSEALGGVVTRALAPEIHALRLVKDEDELRRLRRAIDITVEALRTAMRAAEPGMYEYEIEAIIEYVFRSRGAERVGFPSIVGSGINSTILHYDTSRRRTEDGDLIVADVGAEFGYYTADITRTFPVSGRFTERQWALYELVLATQRAALDAVRPGVTIRELNRLAKDYMRDHSGELCGEETCDRYFLHGVSHWLGMDVHDVGDYSTPLAPGMVLTVEPGLYLPEERIGIRIEDDVLVTAAGHEVLSAALAREPDEIERLMAEPGSLEAAGVTGGGR